MPAQLTTKAQVNGYRFLLRRLEHALIRRDVRMLHDPMRSQLRSLMVGLVLAVLVLAGFGVYGLIKPQGTVGNSKIIISKKAGAMYVVVGDRLHPVLNLASARLITGSDESPKSVSEKKLTGYARGPLLGIPGAPAALPGPADTKRSDWTVCDASVDGQITTTVQAVPPVLGERIRPIGGSGGEAVLVSSGGQTYLVGPGRRSRVDTESVPVRRALGLDDADVRAVSPGVLNALPETSPIVVPDIPNRGAPSALGSDTLIGSVFKVTELSGEAVFYVALAQGVQRIGAVAAEVIRQADRSGADIVPTLSPGALTGVDTVSVLPVDDFPSAAPHFADDAADPVVCAAWSRSTDDHEAELRTLLGSTLPLGSRDEPVPLSGADGAGPGVDAVFVTPGRGHYIQATGSEPDSTRAESLFYVSDSGVRFGVPDLTTADVIGLGDKPLPAPWSMVSLLAVGPSLSQFDALVSHDGIAPDLAGAQIQPPGN
jgi:type VII secretion protein EccB